MKNLFIFCLLAFIAHVSFGQQIKYIVKNNDWDADSLGNHRVALTLQNANTSVAKAIINWRRNDLHPEEKQLFVVDSASDKRIMNVSVAVINRETCMLYFEPVKGDKKYFVYYMPYKVDRKSSYPNVKYLKVQQTAAADWLQSIQNNKDA